MYLHGHSLDAGSEPRSGGLFTTGCVSCRNRGPHSPPRRRASESAKPQCPTVRGLMLTHPARRACSAACSNMVTCLLSGSLRSRLYRNRTSGAFPTAAASCQKDRNISRIASNQEDRTVRKTVFRTTASPFC